MKRSRHWQLLAFGLVIIGLAIFAYKAKELKYPIWPSETSDIWTVQARVQVAPGSGPVKVDMKLPTRTPHYANSNENFVSRGFGLSIDDDAWQREANWAIRRAQGDQALYYRAVFYRHREAVELAPVPEFSDPPVLDEPFDTALSEIVEEVRAESADIASFTAEVLNRINDPSPEENVALFTDGPMGISKPRIAQLILSGARIPSLLVSGIRLGGDVRSAPLIEMLAVHNEREWIVFDPVTGDPGLERDFLIWWTGSEPMVEITGGRLEEVEISTRRQTVSSLDLADERSAVRGSRIAEFSLLSLPVQTQAVYEILLLIPIGAFVIVLLRNVVGIRSFGTFMPVLIAIAFRETQLVAGIILFTVVVGVGLGFRFYLERLRLLLVPRLTAILTIVVLLLAVVSVITHRMGIEVGLSVALFPMVIIAMVIERMSIAWEEHGPASALMDGFGSLLIAALAYLVMGIDLFAHWVIVFPELLLVLLGVNIALGRYTGYRISELTRFREIAKH